MTVVALISTYEEFHTALRAQAEKLGVSRETIDALAGLPSGYAAKVLAPRPLKRIGPLSMPLIVPALGLQLALIEDVAALERIARREIRRDDAQVRSGTVHTVLSARKLRKMQRKGGVNSRKYMSKRKASALGRRASKARWAKAREHTAAKPVTPRAKP